MGLNWLGVIGRMVAERLRSLDVRVIAYDPYSNSDVDMVSLEELFREADVVSLHAPHNDETENMITGAHFASMKRGATFINTARGAIVCEKEMLTVLRKRPDLTAVLDVTDPEPAAEDSPVFTLPNVVQTLHIAGSLGLECRRMGRYMVDELRRYLNGEPLRWQVTREVVDKIA